VALLEVADLRVSFSTEAGVVDAVRGLSFHVDRGKTLGIVGESGSGKSVATQTITGLTRGAQVSGHAWFDGIDLLTASDRQLRAIRGVRIGMIFQDPLSSLHPAYRVGWQIVEMIQAHESVNKTEARARAAELLRLVGIPRAADRIDDYPHQFSGGMRQRVMIAMAMALNPDLLIADEPTTALDVTVQAQVLTVMRRLQDEFGTAIILITHDLGVIAEMADDVVVMYAGSVMEQASRREIFYRHHNPYTEGLFASLPARDRSRARLTPIAGSPPSLIGLGAGCPFSPRCRYVFGLCKEETPPLERVYDDPHHLSACWLPSDLEGRELARGRLTPEEVR
jgi:oligopeptide/dipeptide ABC transporter ATP-binding protein